MDSQTENTIEDDYPYCPNWKEAHYNMARLGPRYHPLDVFTKFDDHRKPIDRLINASGAGVIAGVSIAMVAQYGAGRPVFSQIHRHIIGALVGFVGAYFTGVYVTKKAAMEQGRLMLYIQSRPEYFHPIDRYKYKETLGTWRLKRLHR
ncbi:uncharacterized protein LOC128389756 [Panonychus citri]|uniref:uncharacterized protein LOC128389756 n=1 Tax=Panonychus citri TaxID=50023 RepID=UPI002307AB2A|nr:uncharacterized protein LOC128389756 [Panonychus citri]